MTSPTTPAIEFRGVSRTFADGARSVLALDNISFQVEPGEIFGVLGESGAGKSTLLRMMNGIDHPTQGEVRVGGVDLSSLSHAKLNRLRHRIGVVFQAYNLVSNLTVRDNVALPLRIQGTKNAARVSEMIEFVGLADRTGHFPAQLSGGEKQRVAIARALVSDPSLLLCDEPTSALDTHTTSEILALLAETRASFGTTIVLVTHELDAVRAICDRAAVFEAGALRDTVTVAANRPDASASYVDHVREVLSA